MLLEERWPTKKHFLQKEFASFVRSEEEMCPNYEAVFRLFPRTYSFPVTIC